MTYQYRGKQTIQAVQVQVAEERVRERLQELAEMEARINARIEQKRDEDPIRRRGKVAQCGTPSGYQSHLHHKTTICQPCREARAIYQREYRRKKRQNA